MNTILNNMKLPKFATILKRWTFSKTSNGTGSQKGSVIIFTLLILGSMLAITLALVSIYLPKLRVISDAGAGSIGAIYAADSAIEWCLYNSSGNIPIVSPLVMSNGATYTFIPPTGCQPPVTPAPLNLNVQAVGTYRGVSRSLQVTTE